MEDVKIVKVWEQNLRHEIEGFKDCKERVLNDPSVPKQIKDRFVDVLRTLKMNMIQVMAKCTQLRTGNLSSNSMKGRIEKLKFEYNEARNNLGQLMAMVKPACSDTHGGLNHENEYEMHSALNKELNDIRNISNKIQKRVEEHIHEVYEQRIEVLQVENQELRKMLERVDDENTEIFEIIHMLKVRVEKLENCTDRVRESARNSDIPIKRMLLRPSSHAEDLLKV